ncbi:hypothetical protein [Streptomyces sp. TS71-3]|uniref:hypothetical protein n=1 Tax=Streptomyces sp. TS71-3 TaxID=2733862 RepID=UPI001B1B3529|nr:hypothetical protein [Streptomyces sp. TS71-3]GHJ35156.1 hypothetical protein Sm713_07650 [Streptomyces sp. TS71-3]
MSLVALIAQANDQGLATAGLACLDRCTPLLGGEDGVLRPLWTSIAEGEGWPERLAEARVALGAVAEPVGAAGGPHPPAGGVATGVRTAREEARALVLRMLGTAPEALPGESAAPVTAAATVTATGAASSGHAPLNAWADACSLAALRVHALMDGTQDGPAAVAAYREGRTDGITPLAASELRSQTDVLTMMAEHGAGALRHALEVTTEGRRILRAAVSRRARVR